MIGLGIQLAIWSGRTIPTPSPLLADLFEEIKIESFEDKPSAFELRIRAGRSGPQSLLGYLPITLGSARAGNRIILTTAVNGIPRVLIDGVMTHVEMQPSEKPGAGRITIKGEDMTFYMTRKQVVKPYQKRTESNIVQEVLAKYIRFGMTAVVKLSKNETRGGLIDNFEMQQRETDFEFLSRLAKHLGYVFFVEPGLAPGLSTAYFGPPRTFGFGQPGMRANMGAATNVNNITVVDDPTMVKTESTKVLDPKTKRALPSRPFAIRPNLLALFPTLVYARNLIRQELQDPSQASDFTRATASASGAQDLSADKSIKLTGNLDTSRYGGVLRARDTVKIGGVGIDYDGKYRVAQVTHNIREGSYTQNFTLARDGRFTNSGDIN